MAVEDPIEARLQHARDQLDRKVRSGGSLEGDDLVDVRDDVLFVYQNYINGLLRVELESKARDKKLEEGKMNKQPWLAKALWILLPSMALAVVAVIRYLSQIGVQTP